MVQFSYKKCPLSKIYDFLWPISLKIKTIRPFGPSVVLKSAVGSGQKKDTFGGAARLGFHFFLRFCKNGALIKNGEVLKYRIRIGSLNRHFEYFLAI